MRETGLDVRRHAFTRAFRGFDETEVEAVLQAVAVDFDEARATLRQLESALAEASAEAEQLLQGERSVMRVMRSADEHARMCVSGAHRQAARVVAAAEEHAQALLASAEAERTALANEVRAIEQRRAHVLSALDGLIDAINGAAVFDVPTTRDTLAMRDRNEDAARNEGLSDPIAVAYVSSPVASAAPADVATPLVSIGGTSEVVASRQAAALDSFEAEADGGTDAAAIHEERVVRPVRHRLFILGTRRAAMAAAAVVLSAAAIAWPSVHGSRRTWAAPAAVPAPVSLAVQEADDAAPLAAPAPAVTEPAPIAPLVVALTSSRPCWVRVIVDGVAEELMLGAGDEIARTAKATIRVRIGDAAALSAEVNGHALPPLGLPGQVVERTFTADSLRR